MADSAKPRQRRRKTQPVLRSVQGARRSAPGFPNKAGVLEPYVEHREQAQRSNGGPIMCFDRQLARNAG